MNGSILILGTLSAFLSLIALLGGLAMLAVCFILPPGEDRVAPIFILGGCFWFAISVLLGMWVPAPSWIFVGALLPCAIFLATVKTCLAEEERDKASG